jgi:hypothetical protein
MEASEEWIHAKARQDSVLLNSDRYYKKLKMKYNESACRIGRGWVCECEVGRKKWGRRTRRRWKEIIVCSPVFN